jgi:hypothetical protein
LHIEGGREGHRLRVLTSMGVKGKEAGGNCRRLHIDQPQVLYCSPNIIREIKSRGMRRAWHVARMGDRKVANNSASETFLLANPFWLRSITTDPHILLK